MLKKTKQKTKNKKNLTEYLDSVIGKIGLYLNKHTPFLYNLARTIEYNLFQLFCERFYKFKDIRFCKDNEICLDLSKSGLCNRLKRLVSLMRLADHFNKKLYVYWKKTHKLNCSFFDLFETNLSFVYKLPLDSSKIVYIHLAKAKIYNWEVPKGFAKLYPDKSGEAIDFEYNRIPKHLQKEYLQYFNKLTPIKKIKRIVEKNSKKISKNTVGVHIRRTDFLKKYNIDIRKNNLKFMKIMDKMVKKNSSVNFFLATDCPDTESLFKKKYRDRIFTYKKRSFSRANKKGMQDALIDLLLLSKTRHILGSWRSTFTKVAWWFGKCKAKIDIII